VSAYLSNTPALFITDEGALGVTAKLLTSQPDRPVGEAVLDILAEPGAIESLVRIFATPVGLRALARALAEAADLVALAPEGERIAVAVPIVDL